MPTYVHALTEIEAACGVTLSAVADALQGAYMSRDHDTVTLPANTPPAVAGSAARAAFAGAAVEFSHLSLGTYPLYRKAI